jgi:integrase
MRHDAATTERHTTGSLLIMSGADLAAVQRILRHADPKLTTEVYAHLAPEYLRAEVDRLSFGEAVLAAVPPSSLGSAPPLGSARAALRSGRTEPAVLVTRLLPDAASRKTKAGTREREAQEFRPENLERETGFEPATLSLGS